MIGSALIFLLSIIIIALGLFLGSREEKTAKIIGIVIALFGALGLIITGPAFISLLGSLPR